MNIAAIIAEYNPLHNGHLYHLKETKKLTNCDGLICVMSGNFAQRGIPTIIDKWSRTKLALDAGIDLVIELPTIYSLSSAEFFAYGAVSLLDSLNVVNYLSFGSESGSLELIKKVSEILIREPYDYKTLLKKNLNSGASYPSSRNSALKEYLYKYSLKDSSYESIDEVLNNSNNILSIEYCKSLLKLSSSIKPITIKREGSTYNTPSLKDIYCSATAIRKHLKYKNNICELKSFVPNYVYEFIKNLPSENFSYEDDMFEYIKFKYLTNGNTFKTLPDVKEGLDNKICKSIEMAGSYEELLKLCKSKRYTLTRLSRILCQFFVGFDRFNTEYLRTSPCPYARVLGFNDTGRLIMKKIKQNSKIPLYTKLPKSSIETLNLDIQSTKAYSIINNNIKFNSDYLISPLKYL